jgi:hypothetical protein
MLLLLVLWPTAMQVIGPVWFEKVRIGELAGDTSPWPPADGGLENEMRPGKDQTCILASSEPDRMKLFVGSMTSEMMGCRCEAGVETCLPEHI